MGYRDSIIVIGQQPEFAFDTRSFSLLRRNPFHVHSVTNSLVSGAYKAAVIT